MADWRVEVAEINDAAKAADEAAKQAELDRGIANLARQLGLFHAELKATDIPCDLIDDMILAMQRLLMGKDR